MIVWLNSRIYFLFLFQELYFLSFYFLSWNSIFLLLLLLEKMEKHNNIFSEKCIKMFTIKHQKVLWHLKCGFIMTNIFMNSHPPQINKVMHLMNTKKFIKYHKTYVWLIPICLYPTPKLHSVSLEVSSGSSELME